MRIAYLPDGVTVNAFYRSRAPMLALGARGHQVRELDPANQRSWPETLRWCELLHVHRVCDKGTVSLVRAAKESGRAAVWDDDDDVTQVPRQEASYREVGGFAGARRLAARERIFELVDLVTTPSEALAESFRAAGARHVTTIENYVAHDPTHRSPSANGVTVGWVAALEHRLDLQRLPLREVLQRLLDEHPELHVTTVGLGLGLRSDRYRHVKPVPLPRLLDEVAAFDVGIAPISPEWRINHARSNIKLKEYAAAGVPWLASPIGPYASMGERQGGRLVADDGWYEALEALIRDTRARRKLAKRAERWVRKQTIAHGVEHWDRALRDALDRATRAGS